MDKDKDVDVIIELEDVKKIYQMGEVKVAALSDLNLSVKKGEFLAIIGASGSGKSTALNLIGCLDVPTEGKVYLDGIDIATISESTLAQIRGKKIGFVFQKFNLIAGLTSLENVELPMIFQGVPEKERKRRAEELLKLVELGHRIHHKTNELSGGEQQRVAIARALANNPEVILADEPTGNLDSRTGSQIIELFKKLNKTQGKTIIMITHDKSTTKDATRIVCLRDGKIIEEECK